MPLSWVAGVGNFCFNLLSPFLLLVCILSSQAISFQILLYPLFQRFPWSTILPIPSYFKLHNLTYLGDDISTDDMTIPPQTALNYHIFYLHHKTHPILKNISQHLSTSFTPHIILIIRRSSTRKLSSSTTVSSHVSHI